MREFNANMTLKIDEPDDLQLSAKLLNVEQYINDTVTDAVYRKFKVAIRLHITDEK